MEYATQGRLLFSGRSWSFPIRLTSVSSLFYAALHLVTGNAQRKAGTTARLLLALHLAMMPLSNRAHQRKAQADSAMPLAGAREAVERLEDALALRGRNARSAV